MSARTTRVPCSPLKVRYFPALTRPTRAKTFPFMQASKAFWFCGWTVTTNRLWDSEKRRTSFPFHPRGRNQAQVHLQCPSLRQKRLRPMPRPARRRSNRGRKLPTPFSSARSGLGRVSWPSAHPPGDLVADGTLERVILGTSHFSRSLPAHRPVLGFLASMVTHLRVHRGRRLTTRKQGPLGGMKSFVGPNEVSHFFSWSLCPRYTGDSKSPRVLFIESLIGPHQLGAACTPRPGVIFRLDGVTPAEVVQPGHLLQILRPPAMFCGCPRRWRRPSYDKCRYRVPGADPGRNHHSSPGIKEGPQTAASPGPSFPPPPWASPRCRPGPHDHTGGPPTLLQTLYRPGPLQIGNQILRVRNRRARDSFSGSHLARSSMAG